MMRFVLFQSFKPFKLWFKSSSIQGSCFKLRPFQSFEQFQTFQDVWGSRRSEMVRHGWRFATAIALVTGVTVLPVESFAQTLSQLVDGAKKEGQLIISWGTGTMGGIEGADAMEKTFNKVYGLNLQFKFTPGPAMPQFASRIIQEAKAPMTKSRQWCSPS